MDRSTSRCLLQRQAKWAIVKFYPPDHSTHRSRQSSDVRWCRRKKCRLMFHVKKENPPKWRTINCSNERISHCHWREKIPFSRRCSIRLIDNVIRRVQPRSDHPAFPRYVPRQFEHGHWIQIPRQQIYAMEWPWHGRDKHLDRPMSHHRWIEVCKWIEEHVVSNDCRHWQWKIAKQVVNSNFAVRRDRWYVKEERCRTTFEHRQQLDWQIKSE